MDLQSTTLNEGARGDVVRRLHRELAIIGLSVPEAERTEGVYGPGTVATVRRFQEERRIESTGAVDDETARAINAAVNALTFSVEGNVVSRTRVGVGGLRVAIVDKNVGKSVGGDVPLANAVTDGDGAYKVRFVAANPEQRRKESLDLQARAYAAETFLGASDVRYNASNRETLNVMLPDKADSLLPSEHETLVGALAEHFRGNLRDLQETDDQPDITYLANKTGWDARAVALAALADQFSTKSTDASGGRIEAPFFYALFRAGVPANEDSLYRLGSERAAEIWKQGIKQGVIPAAFATIVPQAIRQFQKLAAQRVLDGPAAVGLSSLREMLSVSLLEAPANQSKFAELYALHQGDPPRFWEAVRSAFGESAEQRLKLDGQLASLTLNNAPLVRKLHELAGHGGMTDTADLVAAGYYRSAQWKQLIGEGAIPPQISGKTDPEKRSRYAEVLAAQVRVSFPTGVVAQMVSSGETPVASGLASQVHAFLIEHQGKFEIGLHSVERYIARNQFQVPKEVSKEIARIQRVYQITPSHDAMNALLKSGIDSALAVSRYDREQFVDSFQERLGGAANARLTHAKAQQVHHIVSNLATSYLVARTAPPIGVHSPAKYANALPAPIAMALDDVANKKATNTRESMRGWGAQSPDNADAVIPYATLEALFGEMDYCPCEHCRSVLSPAAYLVDLLRFLDRNDLGPDKNPLQIFLDRRPDVEHLPLTCENTNTPLPYIDLVNETLEYFVTHTLKLDSYKGHSTDGSVSSEELLAIPQFVEAAAYEVLAGKHPPSEAPPLLPPTPPLPFHQPLENLRRYFDKFETPLPEVMEALRANDELERPDPAPPDNPGEYGWRDILMEEFRLSRSEHALLTDGSTTLQQLYGFLGSLKLDDVLYGGASDNPPYALSYVKPFARRMGVSYEEIVDIVKTRFVNPNSDLVPKLDKLAVNFTTLDALHKNPQGITDADFNALLPSGTSANAIDVTQFGGDKTAWANANYNYAPIVRAWLSANDNFAKVMGLITLTDPTGESDPCNFDSVQFRYANPNNDANELRHFEFHRLIRFIRLWKKLGWTIEQTDKAITALYPQDKSPNSADDSVNLQLLDAGFLTLLPRLGVVKRTMRALKLKPKKDLLPLLACFAPIDTHGAASLYQQTFLYPAPSDDENPFADDGFGNYLTKGEKLATHAEKLRGAFLLTDDELSLITADLALDSTAVDLDQNGELLLTLRNISAVFRRGWLARKVRISVREFLLLRNLTGVDPFALPDPVHPPILRFIDVVSRLHAASVKPEQALYLIWNRDISGKSAPDEREVTDLARKLRTAFAAIETEFALTDDPNGQIARARMALVYGNDATTVFFGLLDNTLVSEVKYDHNQASLVPAILNAAPGHIAYDDFGKRLSFTGVMSEGVRDALLAATANTEFKAAVQNTVDPDKPSLYAENQKVVAPFFDRYPELKPLYDLYAFFGELRSSVPYIQADATLAPAVLQAGTGRLTYDHALGRLSFKGVMSGKVHDKLLQIPGTTSTFKDAIDSLLNANQLAVAKFFQDFSQSYPEPPIDQDAYTTANDSEAERRTLLLAAFLPELKRRRKRQQALTVVGASAKADIAFASAILDDKAVLNPAAASPNADDLPPALDDLTAMETAGLSARLYSGATVGAIGVQPDSASDAEANLAYSNNGGAALPFDPASGLWSGFLEAPENGFYNFSIEPGATGGAGAGTATLTLDGEDKALEKNGEVWSNTAAIDLRAGTLYPITLVVENITAGLKVRWATKGRGWEVVPARYLYPETLTDHLRTTYICFLKAASLATRLKLTPSEMAYLTAKDDYRIDGRGWLNSLPVAVSADAATSTALLTAFEALLDFAGLKKALAPNDERLLAILEDPNATVETSHETPEKEKESLLLALTRWDAPSLDALLLRFGKHLQSEPNQADRSALKDLGTFMRVYRAYLPVKKIGVSASALVAAATNEPQDSSVRAFKAALRARYEESDWLSVLKPISDEMRSVQRDALVAYVLHHMRANPISQHIDTPEKLFEYFLMDVQMDPCMQTSRIRHALSSVQLFIERCLMNLEPRVDPQVFQAKHRKRWEWMKRYRVWEANRKVFLWPENWVEPELRGDQSPFFREAMSELLQSDVTEDRAATALLNYLSKLERVAKLEPCGIHFVEGDPGTADDIAHVVARTAGAHRKYYYRRYEDGLWTPWEQIQLDIEDNPVIPVVWKDRLFLFWLRILKQSPMDGQIPQNANAPKKSGEDKTLADCTTNELRADAQATTTQSTKVTVQAVLYSSEYYDGKWQLAKTSDVNDPVPLGDYVAAGQGMFDRSQLRLWAFEEDDALRLYIEGAPATSFLLYNTHSLPLPKNDKLFNLADCLPGRPARLLYSDGTYLFINYSMTSQSSSMESDLYVLENFSGRRPIGPQHWMENSWEAPFFCEDRRHAFYVTTKKGFVPPPYSVWSSPLASSMFPKVPELILAPYGHPGPGPQELALVGLGASSMKRLISEDAYIKRGLAMTSTVHLDGAEIGPSGSIAQKH